MKAMTKAERALVEAALAGYATAVRYLDTVRAGIRAPEASLARKRAAERRLVEACEAVLAERARAKGGRK